MKILRILAILMICLVIMTGCEPAASKPSGVPTTAPPVDTGPGTETTEPVISSEVPTTYESGESGNETTECVVTTEASESPTEGETEAPTEPKPTEPKPTEPKPTEPAPTEPKPTEPKPTEPKPTEPKPTEPKPTEPKPTEPKPTEPKPTEPAPTEPKPTEPAPTEPTPTNPPHTHSWSAWTQTTAPTCVAAGEEKRTCSCGASETRAIPATGVHTWEETAPTCTEAGYKICKVCGKQETGAAALGHNWVFHEATGHYITVITCRCGAVFHSFDEWYAHVQSFPREERDAHGGYENHSEWVRDTQAYRECTRCGFVEYFP